MSPKQQRGEETARRLLAAALEVHERKGPDSFTVQAVTASSGISLGSLYHHFGSFDGLAAALYARCMADLLDTLIASLERTRTARTGVRAVVAAYLRFAEEEPAKARFIHASAYAGFLPAHTAAIAAAKAPRIERLQSWARPHAEAGRIVDLPDPLMEMLLIGPVAETARRWLAGDPTIDLKEASRALPERIWQSLRGPQE
ncbi:TetR family transcriptional regulator [Streptomyces sp. HUCO-GS316]|uniref:TetR/AcrR family transcriptional regulator n=1 Tax=Streptomyces sp. HUCO-GS316 TaxID=2692198 RepID=UPI0013717F4C|nr:TetR/AcrR family transcriptional regulator [Streptomyces sp. HUCO-GS316]MXM68684.1 TetR family transcriptional regulator [Streptomyces sp. HUCO-GS316]